MCDKCPSCALRPHHSHIARRPLPADLFALVTSALPVVFACLSTTLNERAFLTVVAKKKTPTRKRERIGSTHTPPVCESRAESHTRRSSHEHRVATNIRVKSSRGLQTKQQRPEKRVAKNEHRKRPRAKKKKKQSPGGHRRSHSTT